MKDSGYVTSTEPRARQARLHLRQADGTLVPQPLEPVPVASEFWSGGGPLYSTGRDYLTFLQMLLHGGSFNGARVLRPETVAEMGKNHSGAIPTGVMKSENRALSNDVDFFPGAEVRWGLGYMLNVQPGPNGRSAGHRELGWNLQHLLLARPGEEGNRADHDADPALRRSARGEGIWPVRARCLRARKA